MTEISAKQYKLSKIIWDNTSSSCLSELTKIPLSQVYIMQAKGLWTAEKANCDQKILCVLWINRLLS